MLAGPRDNIHALALYVDGNNDLSTAVEDLIESVPREDDLVILTDLLGGSVNNELTVFARQRPNTYLVTNINLPLIIMILFADEKRETSEVIREACASEQVRVVFMNDRFDSSAEKALDDF